MMAEIKFCQNPGRSKFAHSTASTFKNYESIPILHINGHNIEEIVDAVDHAKAVYEKPTVIIAHTIPGKGIDFMENIPEWHGKPPDSEEARKAINELRTLGGRIKSEHE